MPSSPRNIHPLPNNMKYTPSPLHPPHSAHRNQSKCTNTPTPSRLFLRMAIPHSSSSGLHYPLGPYVISITLTPIDASIVAYARECVEKRRLQKQSKSPSSAIMGNSEVGAVSVGEAQHAVNGVFEYEFNESEAEAPKLAGIEVRSNNSRGNKVLWSSTPGTNFISASHVHLSLLEKRSHILSTTKIYEHVLKNYNIQTIDCVERGPTDVLCVRGQLGSELEGGTLDSSAVDYTLTFSLVDYDNGGHSTNTVQAVTGEEENKALAFTLQITPGKHTTLEPNQAHIFGVTSSSEGFYGFGSRLSQSNAKGTEVHVINQSTNYNRKSLGSSCTVPQFVTTTSRCLYLLNTEPSVFDLRHENYFSIRVQCNTVSGALFAGKDMLDTLKIYTALRGRSKLLPKWTQYGVILGISGGTESVRTLVNRMESCPIAGVLVHDWTGVVNKSSNETRVWYNWIIEREHYKYWDRMVEMLEGRGISLGVYLNPLVDEIPVHLRSGRRYLFNEALNEGYFVKTSPDKKKNPSSPTNANEQIYQMNKRKSSSRLAILDLTNHQTCHFIKKIIHDEIMGYASASFWIADIGEMAPIANSSYHSKTLNGLSCHNLYAEEWARVNREAIRDAGREGDGFFIVNAGYGTTPKYAHTCLGDVVVDYKNKDGGGLQAALNGLLNGGFSGFTYNHCAVSFAVSRSIHSIDDRVREMIVRWMEMMAFTCLFRTHDSDDGVDAVSAYNDGYLLAELSKWSTVYVALAEYRMKVSSEATYRGYPVVRHPILHFSMDEEFGKSSVSSFMLGESLYIAPVMRYGDSKVKVYLPEGEWAHLWTDTILTTSDNNGTVVEINAPVGRPPVFYRKSDELLCRFVYELKSKGMIYLDREAKESKWSIIFRRRKS